MKGSVRSISARRLLKESTPGSIAPSRRARREAIEGYLFILPWIVGFVLWTGGPIVVSFLISLTEWPLLSSPQWVGLANYRRLLTNDPLFWQSLKVTAYYTALSVPLHMAGSLAVALLLNQDAPGVSLFRAIYYLPAVVGGVSVAILWGWIFNPNYGILNALTGVVGLPPQNWINDTSWVIPSFVLMSLWSVGGGMVIYLAGLKGVPRELYDAASVDGANAWGRFRNVTLPLITPVLFFNLIIGLIASFNIFTQANVLTDGGPGYASLFYVLYIYRTAFRYFEMGYASALAWMLFVIVLAITVIQFKVGRRWVHYEE